MADMSRRGVRDRRGAGRDRNAGGCPAGSAAPGDAVGDRRRDDRRGTAGLHELGPLHGLRHRHRETGPGAPSTTRRLTTSTTVVILQVSNNPGGERLTCIR